MAVIIEFANVVLRKTSIDKLLPGGIDALFALDLPNIDEDANLFRVGFMSTLEADQLIERIVNAGFPSAELEGAIALVQWINPTHPSWLQLGVVDNQTACWLVDTQPGALTQQTSYAVLRCAPQSASAVLESLCSINAEFVLSPESKPDVKGAVTRGTASVDLLCIEPADARTVIMITRQLTRRATVEADTALFEELLECLEQLGAKRDV